MELPSTEIINDNRIARFMQRITDTLGKEDLSLFTQLIEQYQLEHNVSAVDIGAALASLLQGDTPLLLQNKPQHKAVALKHDRERSDKSRPERPAKKPRERSERTPQAPEEGTS